VRLSSGSANYLAANTTRTLVSGKGVVWSVVATSAHATTPQWVALYDGANTSAPVLAAFNLMASSPVVVHWPRVGLAFETGLTVRTSADCVAHLVIES
jgi:hypothetical protein